MKNLVQLLLCKNGAICTSFNASSGGGSRGYIGLDLVMGACVHQSICIEDDDRVLVPVHLWWIG